jgi:mono/diheme cytochrome c family protein
MNSSQLPPPTTRYTPVLTLFFFGILFAANAPDTIAQDSQAARYHPTLDKNPPVPDPPAAAVKDFEQFLKRLDAASERSVDSLILHDDSMDRAEEVLLDTVGVPEDLPVERHLPFISVNPEAIFGLFTDLPTIERGFGLYQQYCAHCHGVYGRGNGASTSQWYVGNYPRNFTYGKYKSRSTSNGTTPTDSDLFRTLTRGLYGSTMPSFRHLSTDDRWALVQFLKTLANYFDDYDEVIVNRFAPEEDEPSTIIDMSEEPPVTLASVTRGRKLFVKNACVTCHQGTKKQPFGLSRTEGTFSNWSDEMGRPIYHSRDLTTPVFMAGSAPADLFRIVVGGPNIGPMPNYENLSREDSWAIVHYMQSLFKPDYPQAAATDAP